MENSDYMLRLQLSSKRARVQKGPISTDLTRFFLGKTQMAYKLFSNSTDNKEEENECRTPNHHEYRLKTYE